MAKRITEEEKVALQIAKSVSDLRLDVEMIGRHIADIAPSVSVSRLIIVAEAAEYQKEVINGKREYDPLY